MLKEEDKVMTTRRKLPRVRGSNDYDPIVLTARMLFSPEESATTIVLRGGKRLMVPFIVDDPTCCYHTICESKRRFDPQREVDVLEREINRAKAEKHSCRLMGEGRLCSSVIACRYRHMGKDDLPHCNLMRNRELDLAS